MINFFQITEAEILNIIEFCNKYKDNIKIETSFIRFSKARNLLILLISILLFLICLLTFFNINPKNVLCKEDNYKKLDLNKAKIKNMRNTLSIKNMNNFTLSNSYYNLN